MADDKIPGLDSRGDEFSNAQAHGERTMKLQEALEAARADMKQDAAKFRAGESTATAPKETPQKSRAGQSHTIPLMTTKAAAKTDDDGHTKVIRSAKGKKEIEYFQEPVVGWLVVVEGPGVGAYRPIFMGNNAIGRDSGQRVPIDFGDTSISKEEQAFIRYDSEDRQFLFVPNLAKTNVVSIDDVKPTSAVQLKTLDIITMGCTKLVFVPFCGADFDWADVQG